MPVSRTIEKHSTHEANKLQQLENDPKKEEKKNKMLFWFFFVTYSSTWYHSTTILQMFYEAFHSRGNICPLAVGSMGSYFSKE